MKFQRLLRRKTLFWIKFRLWLIKMIKQDLSEMNFPLRRFLNFIVGRMEPDSGSFKWGVTTSRSYFPKDNTEFFKDTPYNLIDWLRQYSVEQSEIYIRGFLGRMLFSGDDALKPAAKSSPVERKSG